MIVQAMFTSLGGGPSSLGRARIRARLGCRNRFTLSRQVTTMLVNVGLKARRGSRYRLVAAGELEIGILTAVTLLPSLLLGLGGVGVLQVEVGFPSDLW